MSRGAGLLVVAALAACTVDTAVLSTPDAPVVLVTTCEQAFAAAPGAACVATLKCIKPRPDDPACCNELFLCLDGKLASTCDPACAPCVDDHQCTPGVAQCEGNQCVACPGESTCPECPPGLAPLVRNGCRTCFCAPPSQCQDPAQCLSTDICYPGANCAPGCTTDDPGCCANVCATAEPRCPGLAPLGCDMECDPGLGCGACIATECTCDQGIWSCKPSCALTNGNNCRFPP